MNTSSLYATNDLTYVPQLPYAPVREEEFVGKTESPYRTDIFGYKCAVWYSHIVESQYGKVHTLGRQSPRGARSRKGKVPRGSVLRTALHELPWASSSFIVVVAPPEVHIRPSLLFHSATPSTVDQTVRLLSTRVGSLRSSKQLHRVLQRSCHSVSLSSWELWDALDCKRCKSPCDESLQSLISCDLAAGALKRVLRFQVWLAGIRSGCFCRPFLCVRLI